MTALEVVAGVLTGMVRLATTRQLAAACAVKPGVMARRLTGLERSG